MTQRRELVQFFIDNAQKEDEGVACLGDVIVWDYVQRQPYTFVYLAVDLGDTYKGYGFSKVMHPDRWDKMLGLELAFAKACGDLADVVLEALPSYDIEAIKQHLE